MLQSLSPGRKMVLLTLITFILGACFYFLILSPQLKSYAMTKEQLKMKQAQLHKYEAILHTKQKENNKTAELKSEFLELAPYFYTDYKGSALVYIGIKAADHCVSIDNLEPGGIVEKDDYLELPLRLTIKGNYKNVLMLLDEIENLPMLCEMRFLEVKMANKTEDDEKDGRKQLRDTAIPVITQCALVLYSDKTPKGRVYLEQEKIQIWQIGRDNPFAKPGLISPHPEIPMPPAIVDSQDYSKNTINPAVEESLDNMPRNNDHIESFSK